MLVCGELFQRERDGWAAAGDELADELRGPQSHPRAQLAALDELRRHLGLPAAPQPQHGARGDDVGSAVASGGGG